MLPFFCQPSNQFVSKNSLCFLRFPVSQVTSSCPRTACAFYVFFQPSDQLKYKSSLRPLLSISPVKWPVRIQEQLVPVNLLSSLPSESCYSVNVNQSRNGYDIFLFAILLMSTSPAMDTTYFVVCYSVNVYQSRNGYDIFC